MFRKSAAVMFMLVMALLITLKHPVLGYCLCLDAYFTGDCVCETTRQQTAAIGKKTDTPLSPSCSNCGTSKSIPQSPESPSPSSPCDDCTEHLKIDVGDFVWQASDELPDDTENPLLLPQAPADQNDQLFSSARHLLLPIRGDPSPAPHLYTSNLPLYLKHSVLRL